MELTDQKVLIFAGDQTVAAMAQHLDSWHVPHERVHSSAQAMTSLMNAISTEKPFTTLIIESQAMSAITPVQYAQMLAQESQLAHLSFIDSKTIMQPPFTSRP